MKFDKFQINLNMNVHVATVFACGVRVLKSRMSLSTETDPKKVAARLRALQPTEKTSLCHHCGKVGGQNGVTLKACSNCKSVKYCSKTCQAQAWRGHKATCKKLVPPKAESRGKKGANEVIRLLHAAADAGDEGNYDQQIRMIKRLLKSNPDQFGAWFAKPLASVGPRNCMC